MTIREYHVADLDGMIAIWNEVVEALWQSTAICALGRVFGILRRNACKEERSASKLGRVLHGHRARSVAAVELQPPQRRRGDYEGEPHTLHRLQRHSAPGEELLRGRLPALLRQGEVRLAPGRVHLLPCRAERDLPGG